MKISKLNKKLFFNIFYFLLLFTCIFFIIFIINKKYNKKESFQWSQDTISKFLNLQSTINPQSHFNIPIIQNQVSEEDVNKFINNGYWQWSPNTDYLYMDAIAKESIVRLTPGFSLQTAKTLYNENAIQKMLSWNTKEGQFLLNGGKNHKNNEIKCFSNAKGCLRVS